MFRNISESDQEQEWSWSMKKVTPLISDLRCGVTEFEIQVKLY